MRLLFITHKFYPDIGGIEVNSEVLATYFFNMGIDIHLVTWTKENGDREFPFSVVRNPSMFQLFSEHSWAEVVYENNPTLRLSWPNLIFNKPSVIALRTWITRGNGNKGWQDKIKLFLLRRASAVIAISEAVRKRSWENAIVIGNPYRSDLFRILLNIKRNKDFVFLGRLVSDKGVELAILSFSQFVNYLSQIQPDKQSQLTIIGDGPEKEKLINLCIKLNIDKQVHFEGMLQRSSLVTCLNEHKYLLVPSLWEEPFGNVALEGMACGCIPIVSDGGGLPDAVGNAGIIFKRGDANSLFEKISLIYTKIDLQEELKLAARQHLHSHLPNVVSTQYLNVIKGVLKTEA